MVNANTISSVFGSVFSSDITRNDRPNRVVDSEFIQDLGSKELAVGCFVKVPNMLGPCYQWSQNYGLFPELSIEYR
jgi:hypothetical protein